MSETRMAPAPLPTVHIVDDDDAVRDSLALLLQTAGYNTCCWADAEAFLRDYDNRHGGCLLLDVHMPSMSGLRLQQELLAVGAGLPIIFMSGRADVPMAVQALKAGAFDFLQKPCDNLQLLGVINKALQHDQQRRAGQQQLHAVREQLATLTPREREVLQHVVDGKASKVIALELDLSQRTVEIYRANVMQKMQTRSVAQLVKLMSDFHASAAG